MNYIFKSIMMTLVLALVPFMGISAKKKTIQQSDRQYWCSLAYKMAQPVLENMAKGELQKNMQTEFSPSFDNRNKKVLYMECFGRLMAGVAPWLTLPDDATAEGKQRKQLREWALASYKNAVDPQSPDYIVQRPRVAASGEGWKELILGENEQLYFSLRRLDFETECPQDTHGERFHVLALVDGDHVRVRSVAHPERSFDMDYLDIICVPADMGEYVIENLGKEPVMVHKTMLRDGYQEVVL